MKKGNNAQLVKEELLDAIASLDRGANTTLEDQQRIVEVLFAKL